MIIDSFNVSLGQNELNVNCIAQSPYPSCRVKVLNPSLKREKIIPLAQNYILLKPTDDAAQNQKLSSTCNTVTLFVKFIHKLDLVKTPKKYSLLIF